MAKARYNSISQPWLSVGMLFVGGVMLIMTRFTPEAQTRLRILLVVLWVVGAMFALLKDTVAYGRGDRLSVWTMMLIAVLTVAALVQDYAATGRLTLLDIISTLAAFGMLKVASSAAETRRLRAADL